MQTLQKTEKVVIKTYSENNIKEIYEQVFPVVARFVSDSGGSFDDAKDIFHDALVIYLEKKSESVLKINNSEESYIVGISKHLWLRKHKENSAKISLSVFEKDITIPEDYFPTVDEKRLLEFIKLTGKRCLELLRAFYFQNLPVKKIVSGLGYSNEHSASVQKYKCLEKVRNTVKEKSLEYDDLTY